MKLSNWILAIAVTLILLGIPMSTLVLGQMMLENRQMILKNASSDAEEIRMLKQSQELLLENNRLLTETILAHEALEGEVSHSVKPAKKASR
jgi:hypothetical protein